ncbi:hypothetical protein HZC32_00775 [Candidatus Woesearchaeota archaeon]|nr:hypothetical protein [Candidatus Woesearchaeota archaeon]
MRKLPFYLVLFVLVAALVTLIVVKSEVRVLSTGAATASGDPLTSLQLQINAVQEGFKELKERVNALETNDIDINQKLEDLFSNLQSLSSRLDEIKPEDLHTFNTGLASLQQDIKNATAQVDILQQDLEEKSGTGFFTYLLWVLLGVAIIVSIGYYFKDKLLYLFKPSPTARSVPRDLHNHITQKIREGKKYAQIKEGLSRSGWPDEEIEWAYRETLRHNYAKYLQRSVPSASAGLADRNKLIAIGVFSVVLVITVILFLSGTLGQAIYFQKLIGGTTNATSGEVTYSVECTPPHLLNPEQNGCCLDVNNNNVCDNLEKETALIQKLANKTSMLEAKKCRDSRQCGSNLCINGLCSPLSSIYNTNPARDSCAKVCNFYNLDVLTSDGESYTIKPKESSYTAAGALDWTILSAPDHCIEESAVVPIEVVKKKLSKTLIREVITLKEGQTSKVLTHPYAPKLAFTLTIDHIYEVCAEDANQLRLLVEKYKALDLSLKAKD